MDPIEILGSLLGQKAGRSGKGADILKEIFLGSKRREAPSQSGPAQSTPARPGSVASREPATNDIERQARELEDLLNVANNRNSGRAASQQPQTQQMPRQPPEPALRPAGGGQAGPANRRLDLPPDDAAQRQLEQATILIRAMVNVAKSDGQISQDEQQAILSRLDNPSPAAIQFLRDEFAKPLNVREFAWSVPVGMEQQVYSMSLIAIDVDTDREEEYLSDLAHGLRLTPEVCDQIKDRLTGASSRFAGAR